jgi:hypothetical protein
MKNSGMTTKTGSLYNNYADVTGTVQQKPLVFVNSQKRQKAGVLNLGNVGQCYTHAHAGEGFEWKRFHSKRLLYPRARGRGC